MCSLFSFTKVLSRLSPSSCTKFVQHYFQIITYNSLFRYFIRAMTLDDCVKIIREVINGMNASNSAWLHRTND